MPKGWECQWHILRSHSRNSQIMVYTSVPEDCLDLNKKSDYQERGISSGSSIFAKTFPFREFEHIKG